MAIATRTDLLNAISTDAGWLARADLTTPDDDFITMAEARIAYGAGPPYPSPALRVRAMEKSTDILVTALQTGGTTAGTADAQTLVLSGYSLARGNLVTFTAGATNTTAMTLNIESTGAKAVRSGPDAMALTGGEIESGLTYTVYYNGTVYQLMPAPGVPLPANFLGVRRLYDGADPHRKYSYRQPEDFWGRPDSFEAGEPILYTIENDAIILSPRANGARTLKLLYWQKFPALSATVTTNWLLTNYPSVYLYGTLLEAAIYIQDDDKAQWYGSLYISAASGLDASDQMARFPSGSLVCRPQGPTP